MRLKPLVDVKLVQNVDDFNGEDDKWATFAFEFENAVTNIGMDELLRLATTVGEDSLDANVLDEEKQKLAKALYILLSAKVKGGKARGILRGSPRGNGFIVWRRLKREYEGDEGIRHTAMLTGLITPNWDKLM